MEQRSSFSILLLAFADAITALTSLSLCFRCATLFYTRILCRESTPRHPSVRRLFSITFTLSLSLVLLVIFEATNLMRPATRRRHWLFDVYALLVLLIFVLPTAQVYHILIDRGWEIMDSLKASLICEVIFLWIFWRVGKPIGKKGGWSNLFSADEAMGRILIVGTTMLAILSGFTAVNIPYMYLGYVLRPVRESQVLKLERSLLSCLEDVRQRKMAALSEQAKRLKPSPSMLRVEKQAEASFLAYNEACHAWKSVVFSRTKLGRLFTLLGAVMLILCGVRVGAAMYNIVVHILLGGRRSNKETGAEVILHRVLLLVGISVDLDTVYQYATLAFTSVLIAVNMRAALLRMMSVFSLVSTNDILNSSAAVFLAQLMGTYVISSTVLTRSFLPYETRYLIKDVMGGMEFQFFQRWFDVLFLGSVIVSIVLLARDSSALRKLQRTGQLRPKRVSVDRAYELPFTHSSKLP